jgi:hypothetical protein
LLLLAERSVDLVGREWKVDKFHRDVATAINRLGCSALYSTPNAVAHIMNTQWKAQRKTPEESNDFQARYIPSLDLPDHFGKSDDEDLRLPG